jgi:hypothetical protein
MQLKQPCRGRQNYDLCFKSKLTLTTYVPEQVIKKSQNLVCHH